MVSLAGTGRWPRSLARLQTQRVQLERSGTEHSQRLSWRCCNLAHLAPTGQNFIQQPGTHQWPVPCHSQGTTLPLPISSAPGTHRTCWAQPAQSLSVSLLQGGLVTWAWVTHRDKKTEQVKHKTMKMFLQQGSVHTGGCHTACLDCTQEAALRVSRAEA